MGAPLRNTHRIVPARLRLSGRPGCSTGRGPAAEAVWSHASLGRKRRVSAVVVPSPSVGGPGGGRHTRYHSRGRMMRLRSREHGAYPTVGVAPSAEGASAAFGPSARSGTRPSHGPRGFGACLPAALAACGKLQKDGIGPADGVQGMMISDFGGVGGCCCCWGFNLLSISSNSLDLNPSSYAHTFGTM